MITDPPYRDWVHAKATSQSRSGGTRHRELGFDSITDDLRLATCVLAAKMKRWSVIFSDVESVGLWLRDIEASGAHYIRTIPWLRWSMPVLAGDRPPQGFEAIIIAYGYGKGRKHWNGLGNLTHCAHRALRGKDKHRAEKPLDLMLSLVDWFSDPGETVIDPMAGSGTTLQACRLLGRPFIGCELDPDWARRANIRLSTDLSDRDQHRFAIWEEMKAEEDRARTRIRAHTRKVRNGKRDGGVLSGASGDDGDAGDYAG